MAVWAIVSAGCIECVHGETTENFFNIEKVNGVSTWSTRERAIDARNKLLRDERASDAETVIEFRRQVAFGVVEVWGE